MLKRSLEIGCIFFIQRRISNSETTSDLVETDLYLLLDENGLDRKRVHGGTSVNTHAYVYNDNCRMWSQWIISIESTHIFGFKSEIPIRIWVIKKEIIIIIRKKESFSRMTWAVFGLFIKKKKNVRACIWKHRSFRHLTVWRIFTLKPFLKSGPIRRYTWNYDIINIIRCPKHGLVKQNVIIIRCHPRLENVYIYITQKKKENRSEHDATSHVLVIPSFTVPRRNDNICILCASSVVGRPRARRPAVEMNSDGRVCVYVCILSSLLLFSRNRLAR